MVILSYSSGGGRDQPPSARGGGPSYFAGRGTRGGAGYSGPGRGGRGGNSNYTARGRSMTWTNPSQQGAASATPSPSVTPAETMPVARLGVSSVKKTSGNMVWRKPAATNLGAELLGAGGGSNGSSLRMPLGSGSPSDPSVPTVPSQRAAAGAQASQGRVGTSKAGNRVWRNGTGHSVSPSNSSVEVRSIGQNPGSALGAAALALGPVAVRSVAATPATVSTSKAGNRVWRNASASSSADKTNAPFKIITGSSSNPKTLHTNPGALARPRTPAATGRSMGATAQHGVGTTKAGNRVWMNGASKMTQSADRPKLESEGRGGVSAAPGAQPAVGTTGLGSSTAGSHVQKSHASGSANFVQPSSATGAMSLSARIPLRAPRRILPSFANMGVRSSKTGNLVWTNSEAASGNGGATPNHGHASTSVVQPGSRHPLLSTESRQQPPTSATVRTIQQPTARYSGSVNHPLNPKSRTGDWVGHSGETRAVGQVARYSGAGIGRGEKMFAGRGRGAPPRARGAIMARGYYKSGGRGFVAALARVKGWGSGGGRGIASFSRRHPYGFSGWNAPLHSYFVSGMHRRYGAAASVPFRYGHPRVGGRSGWDRGRALAIGRSSRPRNSKFKNRTLIRVRSLILPQSGSLAPVAARRSSLFRASSALGMVAIKKAGSNSPTKFVRSGKHGMTIRRVNSVNLAARRAASALASPTLGSATIGKKRKLAYGSSVSLVKKSITTGAEGALEKRLGPSAQTTKTTVSTRVATAVGYVASTTATPRKAQLLKKIRERSNVAMAARRKAAAAMVVADARVKRARVVGRNMTLYRRKNGAQAGVLPSSEVKTAAGGSSKQKTSKNKKRVKTEQCLFFCKFGKCSKSDEECRFIHDKSKVAVCRAFLKGECSKGEDCLLTHAVQAEKMPVCIYFERGMCFTPNCPYLHVKVSERAAICPNFLKVRSAVQAEVCLPLSICVLAFLCLRLTCAGPVVQGS